jgi:UDP-3-O-[3-hydroxymyristoyl] glucosamine N-acyltransferase
MAYSLKQLADYLNASYRGDAHLQISSVASLEDAQPGDICFVGSDKYLKALKASTAGAVIIRENLLQETALPAIIVDNPRAAYARLVSYLYPELKPAAGIHPTAVIDPSASVAESVSIAAHVVIEAGVQIDDDVRIDAGCYVGRNSRIGRGTHLYPNVTIYHQCTLGEYCIMHSSSVVGSDGFGFEHDQGEWIKIPQIGGVVIGNAVEIGACSVVDRGALQDTVIEDGVKLDNHVQIAHNVHVGEHTVMSRGVGIAGSTRIGKNCLFAGMTGVKDHIEIADNVIVTAMSMVSKSLSEAGSYSSNTPIDETRNWRKNSARFRQLDEMARRIRQLEKQLQEKN